MTFEDRPGAVSAAHDQTVRFLATCGPLPATCVQDALLLVSELVTNAVRHALGVCALDLSEDGTQLTIAVTDTSPAPPRPRTPDLLAGRGGFGWHLLLTLTTHLHIVPTRAGGKSVIATVPCAASSPE
ncbi:ATP-binding protein [Streptacidiphilus sp. PAMC 29251]